MRAKDAARLRVAILRVRIARETGVLPPYDARDQVLTRRVLDRHLLVAGRNLIVLRLETQQALRGTR